MTANDDLITEALAPLAGKRLVLIAPAGAVRAERIDRALAVLDAAGAKARLMPNARASHRYLAGTVADRLADLQAAFAQPDVGAVWCLRGGYGCAQLLAGLDWPRLGGAPLIGHSDITTLLAAFYRRGLAAIHGPLASELALPGDNDQDRRQRAASMRSLAGRLTGEAETGWTLAHAGGPSHSVDGALVGGNLTTLASLAGTPAALTLDTPSIVVLEDVGEAEFRLERCFYQLLQSIDTALLAAVCLGDFERCALAGGFDSLVAIIAEWLAPLGVPLYTGAPVGHGFDNHAWRYGRIARLENGQLTWPTA